MKTPEILETTDRTHTWAQILPSMLDIIERGIRDADKIVIRDHLLQMAKAADLWNEHCKKTLPR